MRQELAAGGYDVNVVAINIVGGESSQALLTSRCTFDLLQDVAAVNAWDLSGGRKDDFFIYREGGTLAPSGYLPVGGPLSTNLSTDEGYSNVYGAIVTAHDMGAGETCAGEGTPGSQLPGDANQDGRFDISDAIGLLNHLFLGSPEFLPCGEGNSDEAANKELLDLNRDDGLDLTDAVFGLSYLFGGGPPPLAGTECIPMAGCPDACAGGNL